VCDPLRGVRKARFREWCEELGGIYYYDEGSGAVICVFPEKNDWSVL
jgi:hypothetical protein